MRDALIPSRTDDAASFIAERELSKRDEAADAAAESRESAAARVTFDDVLENLAALPPETKVEMMRLYDGGARGDRDHFSWKLVSLFVDGLEAAIDENLKGG